MTLIIGIDPGSRFTGYGLIRAEAHRQVYVSSGHLNLLSFPPAERLRQIFLGLQKIMDDYQPQEAAIERVFMHKSIDSALKLGQARGAAIVALNVPITEYAAREVKQSLVGHGAAKKEQVAFMVARILNLSGKLQSDAADALAIAICHAQSRRLRQLRELSRSR